ncbi:uncharacterized protein LOC114278695 isoform X3 [Camellia sinensis]|uniref:uncharacterized protein LOC114278695 isoform X3 n=1 Tax=Camellia sinensis TaxID=4442 RepID=UPI001035CAC4|nr:uncharacterized protein LOC114278695 isoform X3 [Camellia sinensis]
MNLKFILMVQINNSSAQTFLSYASHLPTSPHLPSLSLSLSLFSPTSHLYSLFISPCLSVLLLSYPPSLLPPEAAFQSSIPASRIRLARMLYSKHKSGSLTPLQPRQQYKLKIFLRKVDSSEVKEIPRFKVKNPKRVVFQSQSEFCKVSIKHFWYCCSWQAIFLTIVAANDVMIMLAVW